MPCALFLAEGVLQALQWLMKMAVNSSHADSSMGQVCKGFDHRFRVSRNFELVKSVWAPRNLMHEHIVLPRTSRIGRRQRNEMRWKSEKH